MFVAHLQIDVGDSIDAATVKKIIAFVADREWISDPDEHEARRDDCKTATTEARRVGLFNYTASFVNCGPLHELVNHMHGVAHAGCGLIVNTRLQTPSTFYVVDDLVRVPHLNFDFPDYTGFEFGENSMTLRHLTEVDKTLLRLANNPRKETLEDGRTVERIRR